MEFHGGPETIIFEVDGGDPVPTEEIEPMIRAYLLEMNLFESVEIKFSDKAVAPTSVAYDARLKKFRITVAKSTVYR
jgi:hypothetical protein